MKLDSVKNSRAYSRALNTAKDYLKDRQSLLQLADRAWDRGHKYPVAAMAEIWQSVKDLIRLVRAYAQGDYRELSWQTLLLMVTALVYFVIPTDLIPDILLGWGFVDDATLLGWVISSSKTEIDRFLQWEASKTDNKREIMRQDEPVKTHYEINGVGLNVYEWQGKGDPLLLFHATGFHGRCWDQVVHRLPHDAHVFAVDAPGHGLSDSPNMPFTWDILSEDMAQLVELLELDNISIVGHSFGGYAATMVAARLPERFKQVLLLDPVILDPAFLEFVKSMSDMEHPVARRRNQWASVSQMVDAFDKRKPYSQWDRQVLEDYCRYGLQPSDGESEFELACPPLVEAEIYVQSGCGNAYTEAAKVTAPVKIIRARDRRKDDSPFDYSPSPTWAKLHTAFANAEDYQLHDMSHFFPMEQPAKLAQLIQQWRIDGSIHWPDA